MGTKLTWLSHGGWLIETGQHRVLLDPFLTDNPAAQAHPDDFNDISHILVSHGHFDHVGDTATIARRCGSTVVANFEIAQWFQENFAIQSTVPMNLGGWVTLPLGRVKLVPAIHSSVLPDGTYGGNPGGFLLVLDDARIYFACDTALFSDMRLIASGGLDVAVLPIGDQFTMGPEDSIKAIKLIEPRRVLPAHYGTWPPIEQDVRQWADAVNKQTTAEPVVLEVGGSLCL